LTCAGYKNRPPSTHISEVNEENNISTPSFNVDYDNDGNLELLIVKFVELHNLSTSQKFSDIIHLFKNNGNSNSWLKVRLKGVKNNGDGSGSKIYLRTHDGLQFREVNRALSSYMLGVIEEHFGLGDAPEVETIEVIWPNGKKQTINHVAANQTLTIVED
jgi:hypothetical protein